MKNMLFYQKLATQHSSTCFLNSLLREWNSYTIVSSSTGKYIFIPLTENKSICIPIKKHSRLGRHQYTGYFYTSFNNELSEINFAEMVELLCDLLADRYEVHSEQVSIFKKRVFASLHNIQNSLAFREESIRNIDYSNFTFRDTEQALMIGHSFHPTPKSRDEFDDQDMRRYSPEYASDFCLDWFAVEPAVIYQKCAASFSDQKWIETLFLDDFTQTEESHNFLARGMIPIPMHPWQFNILRKNSSVSGYIREGRMIHLGKSKKEWTATSSLRTVYRDGSPYMLKFSMSLKLTNSIRILLSREVNRGLLLHDVLATKEGKRFLAENPRFHIISEPGYFCLKDADGNPLDESIVVCRENPFNGNAANGKTMLAVLTQDNPLGGESFLQKIIAKMAVADSRQNCAKKWFASYLNVAIKPLLMAYANYGIVTEAHQQNLILDLKDGIPIAAYFRDCQDHAYSEHGYSIFSNDIPGMTRQNGSITPEKAASRFFVYQVIINSTFNIITSLAENPTDEQELIYDLKIFLEEFRSSVAKDIVFLNYLLENFELMHKGNFMYSFKGVHDNVITDDPLSLYVHIQNPILKPVSEILYRRYFPAIEKTISLRELEIEQDLELFYEWQNQPRVAQFWELNQPREELRKYIEELQKSGYQTAVIIEINGEPAGYCEIYWAAKDRIALHYESEPYDRGFHLLIGEKKFLGIDNTSAVFHSIMHFLYLNDVRTTRIVVEPKFDNERFIKYTKIIPSWYFLKEIDLEEKRAALIMSHREKFLMEGVL